MSGDDTSGSNYLLVTAQRRQLCSDSDVQLQKHPARRDFRLKK